MNNNLIIKKLKFALRLKENEVEEILNSANYHLSRSELQGVFVSEQHKNYRSCSDEFLEAFLEGLIIKYRNED